MSLNKQELQILCDTATSAAIAAGQYIQSQFGVQLASQHKEGGNSMASQIVTSVDIQAQDIILSQLEGVGYQYDFGILTEETIDDHSRASKDYFWCVDPLDGTLAFTEGRTGYAVSIALATKAGNSLIGVVYIPDLDDCYTSVQGLGVRMNNEPFVRNVVDAHSSLEIFMDRSLKSEPYFDLVMAKLSHWAKGRSIEEIRFHSDFGAVRNALGVMHAPTGCYFKFPKKQKGGGSIWDYAATRLFFEETDLWVSDANSERLHLNRPATTFMNETGILYTTHSSLSEFILSLQYELGTGDQKTRN